MLLLLIAGAMLAAGCGGTESGRGSGSTGETGETPTATSDSPGTATTAASSSVAAGTTGPLSPLPSMPKPAPPPSGPVADVPTRLLDQIRADAAQRAGVTPGEVLIIAATAQTWNDGSLGCPKPGEGYIQVMTEGFQVLVQAGGRNYDYRTSQSVVKLCEKGY